MNSFNRPSDQEKLSWLNSIKRQKRQRTSWTSRIPIYNFWRMKFKLWEENCRDKKGSIERKYKDWKNWILISKNIFKSFSRIIVPHSGKTKIKNQSLRGLPLANRKIQWKRNNSPPLMNSGREAWVKTGKMGSHGWQTLKWVLNWLRYKDRSQISTPGSAKPERQWWSSEWAKLSKTSRQFWPICPAVSRRTVPLTSDLVSYYIPSPWS